MIVTARQLEDLHRQNGANGHVTLPYRARLTPLAADWLKARRVVLGYSDVPASAGNGSVPATSVVPAAAASAAGVANEVAPAGVFLWWCDGPCGPAKAALGVLEKEAAGLLRTMDQPADPKRVASVVKALAAEVKAGRAAGGVLMVQNAAAATVYANRCPSLRAVVGTNLEAVEQGIQQLAANVLVIEYPRMTLQQMKNLLSRFVRARRRLHEEARRQLEELAACG